MNQIKFYKILPNYQDVCRTCLAETNEWTSIFIKSNLHNKSFAQILMACSSLKISKTDKMSLKICLDCIKQIDLYYTFFQKSLEADFILQLSYNLYQVTPRELNQIKTAQLATEENGSENDRNATNTSNIQDQIDSGPANLKENSEIFYIKDEELDLSVEIEDEKNVFREQLSPEIESDRNEDKCDFKLPNIEDTESLDLEENDGTSSDMYIELEKREKIRIEKIPPKNSDKTKNIEITKNSLLCGKLSPDIYIQIEGSENDENYEEEPDPVRPSIKEKSTSEDIQTDTGPFDFKENEIGAADSIIEAESDSACDQLFSDTDTKSEGRKNDKNIENKLTTNTTKNENENSFKTKCKLNSVEIKDIKIFSCDICMKNWISQAHLEKHLEIHRKHKYRCDICGLTYNTAQLLKSHTFIHTNEYREYICDICSKNFFMKPQYQRHKSIHKKRKQYVCDDCGIIVAERKTMKRHKLSHCGECQKQLCQICGIKVAYYQQHMRNKHDAEKQYKCKNCRRVFVRKLAFQEHEVSCTNNTLENKYHCEECSKSYKIYKFYQIHLQQKHNIPKKLVENTEIFQCDICMKNWISQEYLEKHLETHQKHNYKCNICGLTYESLQYFQSHAIFHEDNKQYTCDICNKTFFMISQYRRHKLIHSKKTKSVCNECGIVMDNLQSLEKHKTIHNGNVDDQKRVCQICGAKISINNYLRHMHIHDSEKKHKCKKCGREFVQKPSLKKHEMSCNKGLNRPYGGRPRTGMQNHCTRVYKCPECPKSYRNYLGVRLHCRQKHGKEWSGEYKCVQCNRTFHLIESLRQHARSHLSTCHNESGTLTCRYQCSACPKSYTTYQRFWYHFLDSHVISENEPSTMQINESREDEHKCVECNRTFRFKWTFKRHIRSHSVTLETTCQFCNLTFQSYHELQKHRKMSHLPSKKYVQCQQCGKMLSSTSALEIHMSVHTGARPYKCRYCENTYRQSAHVFRHERTHIGLRPYKCVDCDKSFIDLSGLVEHNQRHRGDKRFKCPICDKAFYRSSYMKKHLLTHNPGDPDQL